MENPQSNSQNNKPTQMPNMGQMPLAPQKIDPQAEKKLAKLRATLEKFSKKVEKKRQNENNRFFCCSK